MKKTINILWAISISSVFLVFLVKVYKEGRESGLVEGMTAGFDVGYMAKKPQIIIVAPKKDNYAPMIRTEPADSILFRI